MAGYAIRFKNKDPTALRFEFQPAGHWPLTYLSLITQPVVGLGYVNRWAFGPKSQKNRNFKNLAMVADCG